MATQNSQILISGKDETKQAFDSVRANAQNLQRTVSEMQTVMRGWLGAEVVQRTIEFGKASLDARIEVDKLRVVLGQSVGAENVAREIAYLRSEAERLGTPFTKATQAYGLLAAASKETALEGQGTRDIFKAISEASTVLHLSASDTEGALRAVGQMMSKGKVSAEELRGQLGERLPGAFQIAARAMGVTTAELDKMLTTGNLMADEFLPKFAAQIRKEFAGSLSDASKSVQADVNRLQNAWDQLKQTSSQGLIGDAAVASVKFLTKAVSDMNTEMERTARIGGSWFDNILARSAGDPVGETLFGKFATGAAADARSRRADDLLKNRFDPTRAADEAKRQNAFPGRDQAVRAAAAAGTEWDKLSTKFRTAEQKQADLRKEITDTGTAAGKSAAEIEKLIAAATPKGPAGKKAGKSAEEAAFDTFIGTLKSEAATASKAMADLQLEVDTFGLGDQGKQAALIERLRDQREGLAMVSRSGDADAQQGLSSLTTRIAAEERRLELMREMDSLERQSADRAEAQAATAKIISDAQQSATRVREQVEQLTQENATRGLLKSQIEEMTIARMAERLEMIRAGGGSQEYADKLQQEIEYRKQLRDAMRDKELAGGGGDAMAKQLKDATSAADQFGLTMSSRLEESIIHFKSLGDVVKSVGQDIAQMIIRQNVTKPLAGFISGGMGTLAGLFGNTAPVVSNGWTSQEGGDSGSGWAGMLASMIRAFGGGGRAGGGFVNAGQIHPVSENGPELLYSGGKSYLLPGASGGMVQPMAAGGGGMTANVSIQIDARTDSAQVEAMARRGVKQALAEVHAARSRGEL